MALRLNPRLARGALARAAIVVAVALLHVVIVDRLAASLDRPGAVASMPPRIVVTYALEMVPQAPRAAEVAAPRAAVSRARAPVRAATLAAVAGQSAWTDAPIERSARVESAPPVEPAPNNVVAEAASTPAPAASEPAPFDWPESTRLRYRLVGNVRGEVHGSAEVEWIRAGSRYQVHLDVVVGLPFAPMFTRRMSSDGELTSAGLFPRRYDELTKIAFSPPRRATLRLDVGDVTLARGQRAARPSALQDSASQFVQIAWLLGTRPELSVPGARIEMPLVLPRHVLPWAYTVVGVETVHTDFGPVDALHLRPAQPPRPGDLDAQAWFAPTLRHLPARIRIRQDETTYLDLVLARLPELEAASATSAAALR